MSRNDTYPQHVVTAVIVAHDGATWLPHVIDALLDQTRPVQRVVAVDTGSRDRSGGLMVGRLGRQVVFGMDRTTGYGTAVARALAHPAANVAAAGQPAADHAGPGQPGRVEWVWLLHDDCEPAPDALEQLLRGAAETPTAAVLGPKVMDWSDREVILEAGLTIDTVGRRITGIEPREVDQGQHDGDRDTLAVGSAGMLVRRDAWDQVRGFDTGMGLCREDIDFCWRVHAAGYRVRVITDAVVYHAQAMTRRRRAVSVGRRIQLLDRRNALLTLAGNLPPGPMLSSLAGNVTVSFLRALFFLFAKRMTAALDETAAVASVLAHPLRLLRARRMRAGGRKAAYGRLRADLPPGRSVRRLAEFIAAMSGSAQQDTAGSHHATDDDDLDDFLLTDSGLVQRILTSPGVLLFLGLAIVTGIAERSVLGAGTLGGGALLPAAGAGALWHTYLQGFHATGIGSPSIAPPYLAVMAILATVAAGKAWLAVDVVLLGSVPIAGMTAYLAVRRVTRSVPVRVWAAASYALIPVATGAISAGRLGTAAAFALVPLIGLQAGRMLSQPPRLARRAAWATGLTIAVGAAFVPLLWPIALLAGVVAPLTLRRGRPALLRNLGIAAIVPPVLLVPWTFQLAADPSALLLEAGAQQPGLVSADLPVRSLMLLSPGGPGLPPAWVMAGLVLAALGALAASRRRALVMSGWTVAVAGLLAAVVVSRMAVRPAAGGPAVAAWPGVALAITAAGLLVAAAACGDSLGPAVARGRAGLRRAVSLRGGLIAVLAVAACSAPAAAAVFWVRSGVSGPVGPASGQVVPALVSQSADSGGQVRTLVLSSSGSQVSYQLLRGSGSALGDADLTGVPAAERALRTAVASLTAQAGGQAVDQGQLLTDFDIGFVLMRAPINQGLASTLDGVAGLRPVSMTPEFDLWRLASTPSRVSVTEPDHAVVAVPSGQVDVSGAAAPAAGGTIMLAEPAGGWHATLNGHPLTAVPSPAGSWAQAFRLPAGGGTLDISRSELGHDIGLAVELLAALVVAGLALPGVWVAAEAQAPATADAAVGSEPAPGPAPADVPAGTMAGGGLPAGTMAGDDGLAPAAAARGLAAASAAGDTEWLAEPASSPAVPSPARGHSAGGHSAGGRGAGGRSGKGRSWGRGLGRRGRRAGADDPGTPSPQWLRPAASAADGADAADAVAAGQLAGPATDSLPARPARRSRSRLGGAARPAAQLDPTAAGRAAMTSAQQAAQDRPERDWAEREEPGRDWAGGGGPERDWAEQDGPERGRAGAGGPGWAGAAASARSLVPGPAGSGEFGSGEFGSGELGRPGRDSGVRSPTGAWPYPEESDASLSGPAARRPPPYAPEPGRRPADVTGSEYLGRPAPPPGRQPPPATPDLGLPEAPPAYRQQPPVPQQLSQPPSAWPSIEPASWPSTELPSSWTPDEQPGARSPDGQSSWSGGQPPDWPAGAGPAWRGGAHQAADTAAGAQPGWEEGGQSAGWPSSGESLEPLPSAELHHGPPAAAPGERSRRRWPAPDGDGQDEGDSW